MVNEQTGERAKEVANKAKEKVANKLGKIWWAILIRGILAIALAISAFVWPEKTMGLLVKLLGAYFLIDGVIGAVGAYRSEGSLSQVMQAIVSLSLGLVLILWTGVSGKLFLILVGVWLVLQGLGLLLSGFKMTKEDPERGLAIGIAAAMAAIGLVFIFWPDTGIVSISWLIGLGAAIIGCLLLYLAIRVRRLKTSLQNVGVE